MKVAIIGGGAAGFLAAISCKKSFSTADVVILEKTSKVLANHRALMTLANHVMVIKQ